jgi:hypothetical protein
MQEILLSSFIKELLGFTVASQSPMLIGSKCPHGYLENTINEHQDAVDPPLNAICSEETTKERLGRATKLPKSTWSDLRLACAPGEGHP